MEQLITQLTSMKIANIINNNIMISQIIVIIVMRKHLN